MRALSSLLVAALAAACANSTTGPSGAAAPHATLQSLKGTTISIAAMEAEIREIMDKAGVPGLSCAIINDAQIAYARTFGVKDSKTEPPADQETIFPAASFSKTVFAYLVMLLVEDGVLDLDRPLVEYLRQPLPAYPDYSDLQGDERYRRITARHCLSHTPGFPNWRFFMEDNRLVFLFDPGERHSYSGEGIALLQMVVEEVTGRDLEDLAQEKIFQPLGMSRTSYVWQEEWADNSTLPHDRYSRPRRFNKRREAEAAGSMATTATDYAAFVVTILNTQGRRRTTVDEMLRLQVENAHRNMFGPGSREESDDYDHIGLGWSLGWGRFDCGDQGRAFFHTGNDAGIQNYTITYADQGIGVVLLSNSDNFESVARELVQATTGDTCSPFDWIGYPRFDPDRNREPPPEPVATDVDPEVLGRYAGAFRLPDGRTLTVKLEEGRLLVSSDGLDWTPLLAETKDTFFIESEDLRLVFVSDDQDNVGRLDLHTQGATLQADKIE